MEGDHCLESFLLALRKALADQVQNDADGRADRDCGRDAEPHPAQGVAALLAEERSDDPDDQGSLEALAEPDYEGREHV